MVDANQQWTLSQALDICARLKEINPFWIEEPTHRNDIIGHKTLADAIDCFSWDRVVWGSDWLV